MQKDFFKNLETYLTTDKIKYIEFLKEILFNDEYKTFLFFDESETNLIRMKHALDEKDSKTIKEISKELGIKEHTIIKNLNHIYLSAPMQINNTFKYYSSHQMSQKKMKMMKKDIDKIAINDFVKRFLKEKRIHTLEQLLVQNPINWSKETIFITKKITEYFTKHNIEFHKKSYEQMLIERLDLTDEEIKELGRNNITQIRDIENLTYKTLDNVLNLSPNIKEKIKKTIKLKYEKTDSINVLGIDKKICEVLKACEINTIEELLEYRLDTISEICSLTDYETKELMEKVILGGYYFDERKCRPKIEILRRILKGKQETIERNEKRIIELKSENNRLQSEIESISEKIEKKENRAKQKKKIKI